MRKVTLQPSSLSGVGRRVRSQEGLTLVEVILAVALLSTILTIAVPRYLCHLKNTRHASAAKDLSATRDMIELFEVENGRFPESLGEVFSSQPVPTTLEYCIDPGDRDSGHGNETCFFFDSDNPSGQNSHGGLPAMGYLLNIKSGYEPCRSEPGEFYYLTCCGGQMQVGDSDSPLGHPGQL